MPDNSRLDRVYAQLMRHHAYGWALYKKVTRRHMFPGACGYFDEDGDWRGILDLNDRERLEEHGWKTPDADITSNRSPESMVWGPKTSGSVKSDQVGGEFGAPTTVLPNEAAVSALFKNESEHGAVLTTEKPVNKHMIGSAESAVQWMVDNKMKMLHLRRDVFKNRGFWIVTKTYSTPRCAVAVMSARSSTVEISLSMDAAGVLTLTPNSGRTRSSGSFSTEIHEDEEKSEIVVFMSGIYFGPKLFGMGLRESRDQYKQTGKIFRGNDQLGPDDNDEVLEFDIKFYPPRKDNGEHEWTPGI